MNRPTGVILCGTPKQGIKSMFNNMPSSCIELKKGYSVLDKQIFEFKCANVQTVSIIASKDCASYLEGYVDKYSGIDINVMVELDNKGSVGALLYAQETHNSDMLVRNADVVTDINMGRFITQSANNDYPATIFVTHLPSPYGVVELDSDRITGFEEKPILPAYINAGVYYIKHDLEIPKIYTSGKIETTLFPELTKKGVLGFYKENVFWRALKTVIDLDVVQKEYENKTDKAWGYEKLLVHTNKYMTKELFIREGMKTSFHQHEEKDETMYVNQGRGYIEFNEGVEYFTKNDKIRIEPKTPHSIVALDNTLLYEFSTPHVEDTTRIHDFYPRDTE